jgi:hypothetical protein
VKRSSSVPVSPCHFASITTWKRLITLPERSWNMPQPSTVPEKNLRISSCGFSRGTARPRCRRSRRADGGEQHGRIRRNACDHGLLPSKWVPPAPQQQQGNHLDRGRQQGVGGRQRDQPLALAVSPAPTL